MKNKLIIILALALTGCASFNTTQTDERTTNPDGSGTTKVTTKVSSSTFAASKSNLANFKAKQSEANQSADVGNLGQAANIAEIAPVIEAVFKGLIGGAAKAVGVPSVGAGSTTTVIAPVVEPVPVTP